MHGFFDGINSEYFLLFVLCFICFYGFRAVTNTQSGHYPRSSLFFAIDFD